MRKVDLAQCICRHCGKTFFVKPHRIKEGSGKYCSYKCATDSRKTRVTHNCMQCGKPTQNYKYCSKECSALSQRNRVEYTCIQCGKVIVRFPYEQGRRKYCSNECRFKAQVGAGSPVWRGGSVRYGANWITQRDLAYQRDGGECQVCHRKPRKGEKRFEVHHIVKARTFNRDYIAANDLNNLITLCRSCHGKAEHGLIPVPARLL